MTLRDLRLKSFGSKKGWALARIFPGLPLKNVYEKRFLLSKKVIGTNGSWWSTESLKAPILNWSNGTDSLGTPPSGKIQILNPC